MTKGDMQTLLMAQPEFKAKDFPESEKADIANIYIDMVVNRMAIDNEWSFAVDRADETIVANQANYTLKGNSNNCRSVLNIRYGVSTADDDGFRLLIKKNPIDMDDFLTDRTTSGVYYWIPDGRKNDFPVIRLVEPSADTTYVLRYRFVKKNIDFDQLPQGFEMAVLAGCRKLLVEVPDSRLFRDEIGSLIDNFEPSGGESRPVLLDSLQVAQNNELARHYGWGN